MDVKIALLSLALVGLSAVAWGGETREYMYVLGASGKSLVSIVVQEGGDPAVSSAATELQSYIEKASGAKPTLVTDGATVEGQAIHVGRTRMVVDHGISFEGISREGYVIHPLPDVIVICGATDYGTVHGVYGFLQDLMGVRWLRPGELWEVVPKADPLSVRVSEIRSNPDYSYRIFSGLNGTEAQLWYTRSRLTKRAPDIPYNGFGHNLNNIFPPSKYGEEHPEYYGEIRGKRVVPENDRVQGTQPCFTNPDVIRITVETAREFFYNNPTATQYSLCVNDNLDFCTCPKCSKLDLPEVICGHGWRTYSDSYFYYVEQVAKELAKSHPDKTVGCYAYWGVESVPRHIKRLPENVVIMLTQDTSQHFDPAYRKYDKNLHLKWKTVAKHVQKYDYYGLGWLTPRYFPRFAADDLKFNWDLGIDGIYIESHPFLAVTGPQLYMASRLLWNIDQDPEALLDEYMTISFGDAAPTMHKFYKLMECIWTKQRQGMWFQGLDWIDNEIINFDAAAMTKGLNLLHTAYEESIGPAKERIDEIRKFYRFSFLIPLGYESALSMRKLPLDTRADAERLADEMKRTASLASLAERTWATTLKDDPMHDFNYYNDVQRFWNKFGGWQNIIVAEEMDQLTRLLIWSEKNMENSESKEFLDSLIRDLRKVKFRNAIDFRFDVPKAGDIHIDGDLKDWMDVEWTAVYDKDGNTTAEFALAWNDDHLYFACKVEDDLHLQSRKDGNVWSEDSIQIGLDTLYDARQTEGFASDDYEYGFALTETGPVVWCCQGDTGKVEDIPFQAVHNGKETLYEAAIPWTRLKPLQPTGGEVIGLNVLIFGFDGKERSASEWGAGRIHRKDPRLFYPVRLSRE